MKAWLNSLMNAGYTCNVDVLSATAKEDFQIPATSFKSLENIGVCIVQDDSILDDLLDLSKSAALYERMRNAIQRGDHALMWEISEDSDYDVNREDKGGLGRVALHTAVQKNDQEALKILLSLSGVEVNKRTAKGMTPALLAAERGKAEALEVLLGDDRVNAEACDDEDQPLEDIINTSKNITNDLVRNKTRSVLEQFRTRQKQPSEGGKVAIVIGNSIYRNRMSNLEGAKRDLEEASAILESVDYKVHKVENSENILDDIEAIMKEIPDNSISHLHFHYLGR